MKVYRQILQHKPVFKVFRPFYLKISKGKEAYEEFNERLANTYPINQYDLTPREKKELFDECMCYKYKYGTNVVDYFLYELYRRSEREVATFMSERERVELYRYADNKDYLHFFGNKKDFYSVFNKYMNKNCFFVEKKTTKEEVDAFLEPYAKIVLKPVDGQRGIGVRVLPADNADDRDEIWKICKGGGYVLEELIRGCPELQEYHPKSLNTIRVSTVLSKDGQPHIMAATIRTGTGSHDVDNGHSGGIYAAIDPGTGIIETIGYNANGYRFPLHPDSNKAFAGTQIPKWDELCRLCKETAVLIPQMRYIGWDWALDQDYHWILIEGNEPGGIDVHQHPTFKGLAAEYRKMLYS